MMDVAVAENLLIAALQRAGCDLQNATALAANMCLAELSGAHSHGFFRLPGYLASLRSGKVNGAARPFTLAAGGWVTLDAAPAAGAAVTADFAFDVPVRFAEDRLTVSRATFQAGSAVSVPLVELREAFP